MDGVTWEVEGPPHWFRIEELSDGRIFIDYWRWDGKPYRWRLVEGQEVASSEVRFWVLRVGSLAAAKRIIEGYKDVGLDAHSQAQEYKPNEETPELEVVR